MNHGQWLLSNDFSFSVSKSQVKSSSRAPGMDKVDEDGKSKPELVAKYGLYGSNKQISRTCNERGHSDIIITMYYRLEI